MFCSSHLCSTWLQKVSEVWDCRCRLWVALHPRPLLCSVNGGENSLIFLLGVTAREPNFFLHAWNQSCDAAVTGSRAVLPVLPTLGKKQMRTIIIIMMTVQLHQDWALTRCELTLSTWHSAVHQVISAFLLVPPNSFPGCPSPPDAVTWPHWAALGQTGHTAGGDGWSKHTAWLKKWNVMVGDW